MRIVHITDCFSPLLGGIEAQVDRLSQQLAARGHEVTVLATTMKVPARGFTVPWETLPAVGHVDGKSVEDDLGLTDEPATDDTPYRIVRSEWANPLQLPVDPRAPKRFLQFLEGEKPDVVHLHMGELTPGVMAMLLALRDSDVPTVVSVHSVWATLPTVPIYSLAAEKTGLRTAKMIWIPNSDLVADRVGQVIDPSRIKILNNVIDPQVWKVTPVPHEGVVVVAATRFAPRKRVPQLLRLLRDAGRQLGLNEAGGRSETQGSQSNRGTGVGRAKAAHENAPPLRAVIAGDGPGLAKARRFVDRHEMGSWVDLPGRLSTAELVELYAKSDVYLAGGVNDAFALGALEARGSGLAVIARAQSGIGRDLLDGTEGRSAVSDSEITTILVDWARDPAPLEAIKHHNRRVPTRHSWAEMVPRFEETYKEAAALRG